MVNTNTESNTRHIFTHKLKKLGVLTFSIVGCIGGESPRLLVISSNLYAMLLCVCFILAIHVNRYACKYAYRYNYAS